MEFLDLIKTTEILIGLVLTFFGGGVGAIFWIQRQIKASAKQTQDGLFQPLEESGQRVLDLDRKVDEGFREINAALKTGSKRMDGHEIRLAALDHEVAGMPAKDDLHNLQITVTQMAGKIDVMGSALNAQADHRKRLETVVNRIEDHIRGTK